MYVWVFEGNLGDGKTFGMSIIAHYYAAKMARRHNAIEIFSNYGLKQSEQLESYKDFYNVAQADGSIICMDEAHTSLDSRLFQKGSNIYLTQLFFYFRKLRASVFLTTPNMKNIDSRIRLLTNILVRCIKYPDGFSYTIWDYQGGRLLSRRFLPMAKAKQIFAMGLYDTNKMLTSIEFPGNERAFKEFLEKLIGINEDYNSKKNGLYIPKVGAV